MNLMIETETADRKITKIEKLEYQKLLNKFGSDAMEIKEDIQHSNSNSQKHEIYIDDGCSGMVCC